MELNCDKKSCVATIAHLEATHQLHQSSGTRGEADSDVHRLIAECHKLLGNMDTFSFHIKEAFRLAPTNSGLVHDLLSGILGYRGVDTNRHTAAEMQLDVLQWIEDWIEPALEASASAGVASRVLAKAHWIVCVSLIELQSRGATLQAKYSSGSPQMATQVTTVLRRFLKKAHDLDPTDVRFPVELASSYATSLSGTEFVSRSQLTNVEYYARRALALDPQDSVALSLDAWIREQLAIEEL